MNYKERSFIRAVKSCGHYKQKQINQALEDGDAAKAQRTLKRGLRQAAQRRADNTEQPE